MTNIAMLFVCLVAGMAMRVTQRVPENAHVGLNGFIIHIALPALILGQVHGIHFTTDLLWPVMMPWLLFALSTIVFWVFSRIVGLKPSTTGALIMSAGLANTSFVGLPMIEAFYGRGGLTTGIMIDQLGTYLVLGTLGVTVASVCSGAGASARSIVLRIVTFPPLIALLLALALSSVEYPPWISALLRRIGDTLAPLALVSVGLQLRLNQFAGQRMTLGLGLAFKLVLGPLALALLYVLVLGRAGETTQITLFESAMGPQIGGAIVATQYGLDPILVTLMVGIGIALSFLTLPVWWWVLSAI
jgi:predicted permease